MANIQRRDNGTWRARYRDPDGREHARHFKRKGDAERWLATIEADIVRGVYLDPDAGRLTLREFAKQWAEIQDHRPSTADLAERHLRLYVLPVLGDRRLNSVRPSDIQGLMKELSDRLKPSTIGAVHARLSSVFASAVRDRLIATNPCALVKPPRRPRRDVEPLPTEIVQRLADAVPTRYRAVVLTAAGTGLRQGEVFGLTVDRIDFLRRTIRVDQQLVTLAGRAPFLGPPKTEASIRTVPMPQLVVDALAQHLSLHDPGALDLVFTTPTGGVIWRATWCQMWATAVTKAGAPKGTRLHDLRHHFASLLIRHGESVKTVQARLGHSSAVETLNTYAHLWPDSDDRTREAVDMAWRQDHADSVRTQPISG